MKNKILSSIILVILIFTAVSNIVYATNGEIPTKYDLRNEISIEVENQKNGDQNKGAVCYHYAKTKMVETYIFISKTPE